MMNSFNFQLLGVWKILYFTFVFEIFPWYRILGCQLFFSFQCLKDVVTLSFRLYPIRNFLSSLSLFLYMKRIWLFLKFFSLSLVLNNLLCIMCLYEVFFMCLMLRVCWAFWTSGFMVFVKFGKIWVIFLQIFFCSSPLF